MKKKNVAALMAAALTASMLAGCGSTNPFDAAAKTFSNDRITFTEAQVKAEASRCLGCGVSVVDQNKCIGCGLCTTRCEFDAIHLRRDNPACSTMVRSEDKMKAILPHMVKRAAKLTIKDIKEKCAK